MARRLLLPASGEKVAAQRPDEGALSQLLRIIIKLLARNLLAAPVLD